MGLNLAENLRPKKRDEFVYIIGKKIKRCLIFAIWSENVHWRFAATNLAARNIMATTEITKKSLMFILESWQLLSWCFGCVSCLCGFSIALLLLSKFVGVCHVDSPVSDERYISRFGYSMASLLQIAPKTRSNDTVSTTENNIFICNCRHHKTAFHDNSRNRD